MTSLSDLKEGDVVVVRETRRIGTDYLTIARVERTTATQIIVDGQRYRRQDGKECAAGRYPSYITVDAASFEEAKRQVIKRYILKQIPRVQWARIGTGPLACIYEVLRRCGAFEEPCTR